MSNRNNNLNATASASQQKADAVDVNQTPARSARGVKFIGTLTVPYGSLSIDAGEAQEYAQMRADQLGCLLALMQGGASGSFNQLSSSAQGTLLWLAQQMADELGAVVRMVDADARTGRSA